MSSPSNSSSCTSESDLESFTVDEVMGELSEFAPYDDSCEPLATEEEAADYNERVHREEEEEQQFQRRYSGEVPANEWYGVHLLQRDRSLRIGHGRSHWRPDRMHNPPSRV
ncbi:unnamed protein product [Porites lobata]|uniref:Uncharacterized protein n=1 Tax=Porites lobata TaxID=104759 RepID=A0ABN8N680_9CNID|nr:unnamed protein product [Porites lobata]